MLGSLANHTKNNNFNNIKGGESSLSLSLSLCREKLNNQKILNLGLNNSLSFVKSTVGMLCLFGWLFIFKCFEMFYEFLFSKFKVFW